MNIFSQLTSLYVGDVTEEALAMKLSQQQQYRSLHLDHATPSTQTKYSKQVCEALRMLLIIFSACILE